MVCLPIYMSVYQKQKKFFYQSVLSATAQFFDDASNATTTSETTVSTNQMNVLAGKFLNNKLKITAY